MRLAKDNAFCACSEAFSEAFCALRRTSHTSFAGHKKPIGFLPLPPFLLKFPNKHSPAHTLARLRACPPSSPNPSSTYPTVSYMPGFSSLTCSPSTHAGFHTARPSLKSERQQDGFQGIDREGCRRMGRMPSFQCQCNRAASRFGTVASRLAAERACAPHTSPLRD